MTSTKSPTARRVRETFDRTWHDFYAARPPSVQPLDDAQLLSSANNGSDLVLERFENFERRRERSEYSKQVMQFGLSPVQALSPPRSNIVFKSSISNSKTTFHRSVSKPKDGSSTLESSVVQLPQYTFCIFLRERWLKAEEKTVPFYPTFGENDDFRSDQYGQLFKQRHSWAQPGRDADGELMTEKRVDMQWTSFSSPPSNAWQRN